MHLPAMGPFPKPCVVCRGRTCALQGWSSKWGSRAIPLLLKGPALPLLRGGSRPPRRGLRVRPGICARSRALEHRSRAGAFCPGRPVRRGRPCVPRIASRGLRAPRARWRRPRPETSVGHRSPQKKIFEPKWLRVLYNKRTLAIGRKSPSVVVFALFAVMLNNVFLTSHRAGPASNTWLNSRNGCCNNSSGAYLINSATSPNSSLVLLR